MKYQALDIDQGTSEWKEIRRKHLTASQAPVLFGLSPYQTKLQLFEEKLTGEEMKIDDFRLNLFMRGHDAERAAREWVEQNLKIKLAPSVLKSVQHPDLLASLDGHSERDNLILEAKYMGKKNLEAAKSGVIQPHHICQVQTQLLVSGADHCIYFATDESGDSAMINVRPSPQYFDEIVRVSEQFMKDLREGNLPEPGEKDYFIPEADPNFDELARAKALLDAAEQSYEALKKQVVETYRHHKRVKYGDLTIVRSIRRGNVNYSKIPELKAIDLEKYRGASSEVVTVKFPKKVSEK